MACLIEACRSRRVPAEVSVVVAPKEDSPAALRARELGVRVVAVPFDESFGTKLLEAVSDCDWICLAGFLRLLPLEVLRRFHNRILNIHPALLPKFGGKGMYGRHVHEAVLAANETESGCSVHYVTERYDEGETVLQLKCPVLPDDTPESLATRVLELEHQAYPEALAKLIRQAS
jgi:phosphoribosylglycinamide formyltransferase-1